jgi:hypothetical protein
MLDRIREMHEAEWRERVDAIVERYEEVLDGGVTVKGSPAIEFLYGIARPQNLPAHEIIARAKHVGLLNAAGFYHDRADETEAFMLLLGATVLRENK